jgi:hypothetical protein
MHYLTGKILRIAFAVSLGGAAAPAFAQSGSGYGLSDLKSYEAPLAPPANGLAQVIRSENQTQASAPRKFKPNNGLTVTIGGYGEAVVGSTTRR